MKHRTKVFRLFLAASPALAAILFWNATAAATTEMAQKEMKECTFCHTGKGLYSLNSTGKYYKEHKKLPPQTKKK